VTDLTKLTLAQARDGLAKKEFTSLELTDAHLRAIEAANGALNAYVLVTPEHARAQAKESDKRLAAGKQLGVARLRQKRSRCGKAPRLFIFECVHGLALLIPRLFSCRLARPSTPRSALPASARFRARRHW